MHVSEWLADNFQRGLYQKPRTTWRHWPLLPAAAVTAAVFALALAVPVHHASAAVRRAHEIRVAVARQLAYWRSAADYAAPPLATYTVRGGDTLSSAAKSQLGASSAWPALWWANRARIHNPQVIMPGWVLTVPADGSVSKAMVAAALAAIPKPPPPPPAPVAPAAPSYGYTAPAAPAAPAYYSGGGSFQQCVIRAESGGNPSAVNPTSGAGGLYQFLPSTWAALGFSGLPENASVATQDQAFAKAYAQSGTSPWAPYDNC